jgi:hypothetical protein
LEAVDWNNPSIATGQTTVIGYSIYEFQPGCVTGIWLAEVSTVVTCRC